MKVLLEMERTGVRLDTDALREYGRDLDREILGLTQEILNASGPGFNPDSPKQLGEFLFGSLGLTGGKKTASGQPPEASAPGTAKGRRRKKPSGTVMRLRQALPQSSESRMKAKLRQRPGATASSRRPMRCTSPSRRTVKAAAQTPKITPKSA